MIINPANKPQEARAALLERWLEPSARIERHLGGPGYELPDISDYEWYPVGNSDANNWVVAPLETTNWINNRRFEFASTAKGNIVVLGEKSTVVGRALFIGANNLAIILGAQAGINPINLNFFTNQHVFFWGNSCTSNTTTFEFASDGATIIVGEDCMFAAGINVRTHDQHGIFDLASKRILNPPGNVHFEPHVWVGLGASILKGVRAGFGSIIATGAVVSHAVPARTIVAGVPARVIRENVGWVRELVPKPHSAQYLAHLQTKYGIT